MQHCGCSKLRAGLPPCWVHSMDACSQRAHPLTLQDKEQEKKLKQKQRERMQPKMGKLDIDYQVQQGSPAVLCH